ncbi:MAG: thymidylate kinase [Clostridia bacterium]|nr:thymidylate kinase [Clostridia bacterium]MDD4048955.1 thymidylate kinase [Clostridia bacterium]
MLGKLIVIEAPDGSGKKTQTDKLYYRMLEEGHNVKKVEFPNYSSDSSALVKMYLNGEFGTNPDEINPYAASAFYAVDRFATYKKEWQSFYEEGGIILADRYTTSNMVHQAAKYVDADEKNKYLDWLWDFEFNLFALPIPDVVFFLNMPPEYSTKLISDRKNKFTGKQKKDIHEKSKKYLIESYINACRIADKYNWVKVNCVSGNNIRTVDEIHEEIFSIYKRLIV